ncbi:MAG: 2-dehydropantoate 2-reductase [Alphaproteobacteria bacterium]|nr:2-dehydropantoate 2-reductase [Alphaproteobacteria bacterium]
MKITVFGAGAVGGHLAARLAAASPRTGDEIAAVARGAQFAAIAERGLTLLIGDERITGRPRATDRPETLGAQDIVIVTLKSSVLAGAAPAIAALIGQQTSVVFAMNGIPWWYLHRLGDGGGPQPDLSRLDPGGGLARHIGAERVIGCMINSANEVVAPGLVRNSPMTRNRFTLGEPDGTLSRRLEMVAARLEAAGIPAPVTRTIRVEIWDKLVRNLSTAPICALTGEPIAVLGRHPELLSLARRLMREGLSVAAAHGIQLDIEVERAYGERPNSPHKSSMLQDFERGRPPEINGILIAVQAFARAAGVPTPYLDTVAALIVEKARRAGLYPNAPV